MNMTMTEYLLTEIKRMVDGFLSNEDLSDEEVMQELPKIVYLCTCIHRNIEKEGDEKELA